MGKLRLTCPKVITDVWTIRWVHTGDEVIINDKLEVFVVDRLKVRIVYCSHFTQVI